MQKPGIYKIQSIIKPERFYIGSAVNISHRWDHHLYDLRRDKHGSTKLQRHYNKYGECDLQFSVILGCEKEYLIANEQFFIDSYKPYFNSRINAANNFGRKLSKEHIEKIRKRQLGKKLSEKTRQKISNIQKKRWSNPEYRRKMREIKLGKPSGTKGQKRSMEVCKKMGDSHRGKEPWNKGKKATPEAILNQSKSHIGNIPWNKGKKGMYIAWNKGLKGFGKGRKHTEETKEKMRKSALNRKSKNAS